MSEEERCPDCHVAHHPLADCRLDQPTLHGDDGGDGVELIFPEERTWTIRQCQCGCVHDFPDAPCPQCGSLVHDRHVVVRTTDALLAVQAQREQADHLEGELAEVKAAGKAFLAIAADVFESIDKGRELQPSIVTRAQVASNRWVAALGQEKR